MTRPPGTGAGRPTGKPKRVPNVERVACPARPLGGWHWLTNRGATTLCRFCRKDWATLDAEVRG
jgi:hypothetical protein